jgi:hypothetical protein
MTETPKPEENQRRHKIKVWSRFGTVEMTAYISQEANRFCKDEIIKTLQRRADNQEAEQSERLKRKKWSVLL